MIRYAWDEVTLNDSALKGAEWAGIRPSTANERKTVQSGRRDVCNTFVFRHCGKVLRLVVTEDKRQPFFSTKRKFDKAIAGMIANRRVNVPEPYSSTVMAVAVAAVPQALTDLSRVRQSVRCDHCQCVLKDGGPVDEGSAQETFIIDQLNSSQVAKRNMLHDR